ncbi:phytanoyl-CoA dioxygenase family protein [Candidatus Poribacteria bacterium]|nr:phytanoyl-CoA dioxygenase family protein [Candidatus Poribacteria bacterium]
MNEEERYLFDLWGYVTVENVLSEDELTALNALIDQQNYPEPTDDKIYSQRFGGFMDWESDAYRKLLNHPRIMPYLKGMIGSKFRLDHAYGILMRKGNPGGTLHGGGTPYDPAQYYVFRNEQMYNGLTVVSWALTDMLPGHGGFCCIPGSHKSNFRCPSRFRPVANNPKCMVGVHQKAGDAVIFTEALTHGTLPWEASHYRRSILFKYSPGHSAWGQGRYDDALREKMSEEDQRLMLEPPYVSNRKLVVE